MYEVVKRYKDSLKDMRGNDLELCMSKFQTKKEADFFTKYMNDRRDDESRKYHEFYTRKAV